MKSSVASCAGTPWARLEKHIERLSSAVEALEGEAHTLIESCVGSSQGLFVELL